ncbi:hypothetical protein KKG22_01655 [Patescibacteria group bacterium]|nr:hypothetical protein [Patescibacteria group bacterium]MBU1721958.1 hypothetical protein [Patescibacteria group bacterium]MBU1901779.1 hypothetical protein [Patescibacteria group bacterium]
MFQNLPLFHKKKKKKTVGFIHETHQHIWIKFLFVLLLFVLYFIFISIHYGLHDGFLITILTWSFFVLCTPVADAGLLIDFPIRLLFWNIPMVLSELFVWATAICLNIFSIFFLPHTYEKTTILSLFHHILSHPYPFWSIIILSSIGTFLSVKFGDELMDYIKHKDCTYRKKHHLKSKAIILIFIFLLTFIIYDYMLQNFGIEIPL